jgi:excisionase family DNA binding protein
MNTRELAKALGEKSYTIRDLIEAGKIKAEKIPDASMPHGTRYEITSSVEEAREALSGRVRRTRKAVDQRAATKALPANKDLFLTEEAATAAGVSRSTVYNFIKEKNLTPLRNGRNQYIPRTVVEQLRERYSKSEVVQTVTAPTVQAKPDPRIDRLEKELAAIFGFITRFAASCGYKE